ncbi:hypothetical protein Tco_0508585 [Tanacetum coccineum]
MEYEARFDTASFKNRFAVCFPGYNVQSCCNSSTVENVVDCDMLYETEGVGPIGNFKEVEVDTDNETKEESAEMFDDDEHILEDVPVSMNNFNFNPDPKHDLRITVVEVYEHDLDVIDYESFGSDLDDGIDSDRRTQLRELKRIGKAKKQGPNKYYFYLGH